ncbi:ogr/Delta-like zinc finger family protein [Asticcacaulis endophyticus]|uniref:ogr/Delta-like zinc finger family protein n=1 Tax=Asticcacaulis endophyticus TaxID=1395890 RepID=UPI003570EFAF
MWVRNRISPNERGNNMMVVGHPQLVTIGLGHNRMNNEHAAAGLVCEPVRKPKRKCNQAPVFSCAVCGERGLCRSSEEISVTLRRLYYRCENLECGHSWKAHLEFIETISPSALGTVKEPAPMLRLKTRTRPDSTG